MAQNVVSVLDRMLHPYIPDVAEVNDIEAAVQNTVLGEIFRPAFFGARRKEAKDIQNGSADSLSNIYSILQVPEQRQKLAEFLLLMKGKLSIGDWKHLANRLSSDAEERAMQALFEVVIIGNLLAQMDTSRITLNAPTVNGKVLDASITLIDRPVYLELSMLSQSERAERRRRQLSRAKFAVWTASHAEYDGRRVTQMIEEKSAQFDEAQPNVLAFQIFDPINDFRQQAAERFHRYQYKRIGLLLPFNRTSLSQQHVRRGDPSCLLSDQEQEVLIELLSGNRYFSTGYL